MPKTTARKRPALKSGTKRRKGAVKRRRPPRAHLLIIECDSARLSATGLNIGSAFGELVKRTFPQKRVFVVRTSSEDKLKEDLAEALLKHGRFRSILIVGHSNEEELALTSNQLYTWPVVGNWLQVFEPDFMFLAACRAGTSASVRHLFKSISTLREIYASPINLRKDHAAPLALLIVCALAIGRIDEEISIASRGGSYLVTGGELFRWKRGETGAGQELRGTLWDIVGQVVAPKVRDLVRSWFTRLGKDIPGG